ncbi:MAG: nucleotidyltransferase domain-containing protein [Acidobacteriota bacterium]
MGGGTRRQGSERDDMVRAVRAALETETAVTAAYVYGSAARGTSTPISDVDVAVLPSEPAGRSGFP